MSYTLVFKQDFNLEVHFSITISYGPSFNYQLCGNDSLGQPIILPLCLFKISNFFEDPSFQECHFLHPFVLVIYRPFGSP